MICVDMMTIRFFYRRESIEIKQLRVDYQTMIEGIVRRLLQ